MDVFQTEVTIKRISNSTIKASGFCDLIIGKMEGEVDAKKLSEVSEQQVSAIESIETLIGTEI